MPPKKKIKNSIFEECKNDILSNKGYVFTKKGINELTSIFIKNGKYDTNQQLSKFQEIKGKIVQLWLYIQEVRDIGEVIRVKTIRDIWPPSYVYLQKKSYKQNQKINELIKPDNKIYFKGKISELAIESDDTYLVFYPAYMWCRDYGPTNKD